MIYGKREWADIEAHPLPAPLPAMLEDLDDTPHYVLRRYIIEQAWEIDRLRAALVESAGEVDRLGHIEAQIIVVEGQIKKVDRELMAVRWAFQDALNLEEKLSWQKKQRELEGRRSTLRRELFRLMDLESE